MTNTITQFFIDDGLLPHENSNTIVFIHKLYNAYFIDHFRLRAMTNFKHKIITKDSSRQIGISHASHYFSYLTCKFYFHIRAWLSNIVATNNKISSLRRGNLYNGACISEKLDTLLIRIGFQIYCASFH